MSYCDRSRMSWLGILSAVVLNLVSQPSAAQEKPLFHWSFDDEQPFLWQYGEDFPRMHTREGTTGRDYLIAGLTRFVPGVRGAALKFDGFSSYVEGAVPRPPANDDENEGGVRLPRSITIEAWIALAAYPWNWAPVLTTGNYRITGFYFGVDSRGRLGFHMSDGTSVWHECNSSTDPRTKLGLELGKWHHVAATYSPKVGAKVYIDGRLAGSNDKLQSNKGIVYSNEQDGFRIGQNRAALPPSDPIRKWATYPSRYSFDGIIDELKVYREALSSDKVADIYNENKPEQEPELPSRKFPTVQRSGRFGANYTRLKYYPEWDALWPPGNDVDVVVQFDQYPTKLVFWRGTRYSPCWVSENNKWIADQSRETGNNWFLDQGPRAELPTGCIEHMSDTQCRSSRVSIIENNDARCVVNWRYLQMDVQLRQLVVPDNTGFGEWGNEYYYIYPDGLCVRKVLPGYGGWQETIFLNDVGTRPEDNVELDACTLVNMSGESRTYSWEHGYPEFDLPNAVIQRINFKSRFKPFLVFREGGDFEVFNVEVRPEYSHFPWWNHWPVAQVASDGRSASAPDRASHSSLSWGNPGGDAALYGMTDQPAESLAVLARSWNCPPPLSAISEGYQSGGYDYTQRAYVVRGDGTGRPLHLQLAATNESPICNLALVITNWRGNDVSLELNGENVPRGRAFRYGVEYDVEGKARLIAYIEHKSEELTHISLSPHG